MYNWMYKPNAMLLTQKLGLEGEVTKLDPVGPLDFYL